MRLNKDKRIGRVLFIVEGSQNEFSILKRIFCNLLCYSYIEKRRNRPSYFTRDSDPDSCVAVINTRESNIRDISENEEYLDTIFDILREEYHFPVDQSAIYYLFDRDPLSNNNTNLIENYIDILSNPYDNDEFKAGQLLLSYPSIESYNISHFRENTYTIRFSLGNDAKAYIGNNNDIQINKITEATLLHATEEFLKYLEIMEIPLDIDDFRSASQTIFTEQEKEFRCGIGFKAFSMLTLAFLQMGILEI